MTALEKVSNKFPMVAKNSSAITIFFHKTHFAAVLEGKNHSNVNIERKASLKRLT